MNLRVVAFVCLAFAYMVNTNAQVNIPGSAQPGLLEEQIQRPERDEAPEAGALPEMPRQPMIEGAEDIMFVLKSVELQNSSVYSAEDIMPLYEELVGQEISLARVYDLANEITKKYRNDGYILTQVVVPEQDIDDGQVVLVAVEGFIDQINIEYQNDVDRRTERFFDRMVYEIRKVRPLTAEALERQLLLMNDLPGVTARAIIEPSDVTPKAADLNIVVTTKAADAYVSVDNRGSRFVGPLQMQGGITFNELFGHTNELDVRAATAGQTRELKLIEGRFTQEICPNGCDVEFLASYTESQPGYTLEAFDVESENLTLEAKLSYPIWRARAQNLEAYGTFSFRNLSTDSSGTPLNEDRIRALRAGLTWNKADRNYGVTAANVEVSQGLEVLDASDTPRSTPASRANAEADFTKIEVNVSREQFIPGTRFSLYGAVSGQYTENELYSSEQFTLGGSNFGRGYDPSEITGDTGAAAKAEVRYLHTIDETKYIDSNEYYAFYDIGYVRNLSLSAGDSTTRQTLSSAGVGVRVAAFNDIDVNVEVAKPLTRDVAVEGDDDARVFFQVSKAW